MLRRHFLTTLFIAPFAAFFGHKINAKEPVLIKWEKVKYPQIYKCSNLKSSMGRVLDYIDVPMFTKTFSLDELKKQVENSTLDKIAKDNIKSEDIHAFYVDSKTMHGCVLIIDKDKACEYCGCPTNWWGAEYY